MRDSTNPFAIGVWTGAFPSGNMDGLIDEVGFWKRTLTSGERTQLYNSGNGLAYPFSSGNSRYYRLQQELAA